MDEDHGEPFVNRDDPIPVITLNNTPASTSASAASPRPRTPSPRRARPGAHDSDHDHDHDHSDVETPLRQRRGLRGRLSAFKEKAKIQDHLVELLLSQVMPGDDDSDVAHDDDHGPDHPAKPNFTLPTMSNNFRRFNARIGVVFVFQARVNRLLAWRRPTHTLSFLAVYTFVCLDPTTLLPLLPLVIILISILVPSFIARHPAAEFNLTSDQAIPYSAHGPPIAPAITVKPAKELSRDFFHNMRDLQNSMEDFSQLHDAVINLVVPRTNFSDEAFSSALFAILVAACLFMTLAANLIPWRVVFLVAGWTVTCKGHPLIQRQLESAHRKHVQPQEQKAMTWLEKWVATDVILDSAPETREVEIFELQRLSAAGEWESWLFSASPYDPLSPARIAGDRPLGTRFFEDVQPPQGWEWSEKKWALDLWSREWVEERIITGVEIETEGERWVYDIAADEEKVGVVEGAASITGKKLKPSWEEGEDGDGRRGEWRRRRWVRLVRRRLISRDAVS